MFGFCGFLSFVGGGVWVFVGVLLAVVILVLFFCVGAPGAEVCVFACFSPRRRCLPRSCTTFYKLDLRFTYLTRRNS